jgi:hypothetical protein
MKDEAMEGGRATSHKAFVGQGHKNGFQTKYCGKLLENFKQIRLKEWNSK